MSALTQQRVNLPTGVSETIAGKGGNTAVPIEQYLTMKEVRATLGLSEAPIRSRILAGLFHPIKAKKDGKGQTQLLFNPAEIREELERIEALRRAKPGSVADLQKPPGRPPSKSREQQRLTGEQTAKKAPPPSTTPLTLSDARNGEKCAQAVRLFREDKTQLDVVVEMNVDFETAEYYWERYMRAQPGWFLPSKEFARIRGILNWTEERPTAEGFSKAFNRMIQKELRPQTQTLATQTVSGEHAAVEAALAAQDETDETDDDDAE